MDEQTAARIGVEVAAALIAGDMRAASQPFNAAMRKGLPPARLREVWDAFIAEHGAPTARGGTDVAARGEHWVVAVRVAFERAPAELRVTVGASGKVEGLYLVPEQTPVEQVRAAGKLRAWLLGSAPLTAGVVVLYALLGEQIGAPLQAGPALVGVGGWALALSLRGPVALLARRRSPERAKTVVVASSGPLEEGVRLGALSVAGSTLPAAYSLGLGWAAIEIVYALINAFVAFTLAGREGEQAALVRKQLALQGALRPGTALWAVAERASATAFHIGAALLIAAQPLLVFVAVPLHSGLNLVAVRLARGSGARVQTVVAVVGAVTFLAGLLAMGAL